MTARLAAPVAHTAPIHLDAVLLGGHPQAKRIHLTQAHDLGEITIPGLPVLRFEWRGAACALASAASFGPTARREMERLRQSKDAVDLHVRAKTWTVGSGPERLKFLPVPVTSAAEATWWAVGDRRGVLELLRHVDSIGSHRRHGYGVVREWIVEATEESPLRTLLDGARAARNLPAPWCRPGSPVSHDGLGPPYWHRQRRGPCVAAGALAELEPDLVDAVVACAR